VLLGMIALGSSAYANCKITGAIFTTDAGCQQINGNIYDSKDAVYLNGGPVHNQNLTDGSYFVQVTTPDGATVLGTSVGSPDSETPAIVSQGSFASCLQLSKIVGNIVVAADGTTSWVAGYNDTTNPGGVYKVWVSSAKDFAPSCSKTDNFKVNTTGTTPPPQTVIFGHKFYDHDTDGENDDEAPIPGWKVVLIAPDGTSSTTFTDADGAYKFIVAADGSTYPVEELPVPPGFYPAGTWLNTTAVSQAVTSDGGNYEVDFGNVCLGAGGGLTLGFWSNKNGQTTMATGPGGMSGELALLAGLSLRDAREKDFDPTTYASFRTWILGATATNMGYMLSAQLAAMELNVLNGKVSAGSQVYSPSSAKANAAGFVTVGMLMTEANEQLAMHGCPVLDGDPDRAYLEALKTALDKANNNITFVQPGPTPFATPY